MELAKPHYELLYQILLLRKCMKNITKYKIIYLLHQDTDFFQSGLGDIQEISLEVGSGHGYKKKVTIIITRSCESFQITLKICRVNITKCEI